MGEVQKNVYELAQERLHIIFKEFDKYPWIKENKNLSALTLVFCLSL